MGELAGYVWRFLEEEGETSVSGVTKAVDAPRTKVNMAIGWLAREEKLEFVDNGRGTSVRLS
ncbi:MAG: winged helix-turn-helix domain-containing protein [Nanohaloarchaea archaeon]|nr:winged helix-turn-helix domain-containing protein [Candidatus Nanohaloarchaea archaeon]